jgi:hypothetical protein
MVTCVDNMVQLVCSDDALKKEDGKFRYCIGLHIKSLLRHVARPQARQAAASATRRKAPCYAASHTTLHTAPQQIRGDKVLDGGAGRHLLRDQIPCLCLATSSPLILCGAVWRVG